MTSEIIKPNTTQVPNVFLDEWMPRLSDAELRVLLVVVRQTLGWVENSETKRRKEQDWISRSQLVAKTGKGKVSISAAVRELIETHNVIEAVDGKGRLLNTTEKRMKIGAGGKIFYRLNVRSPQISLFDKPKKAVQNVNGSEKAVQKKAPFILNPTKETLLTKESSNTMRQPEASASDIKAASPHKEFIKFWDDIVPRTRGIKPIYTGADMKNLKRILDFGIRESDLEQIALFFLADYSFRSFSPSISTLCSSGIINGLLNRSRNGNDPEFWRKMTEYMERYFRREKPISMTRKVYDPNDPSTFSTAVSMSEAMKTILSNFSSRVATPSI